MAREFIRSSVIADQALVASTVYSADLGVNGLSFLFLHLTGLQGADNVPVQVQDLLTCLATVDVAYLGRSVLNGSLADLARLSWLACGWPPYKTHAAEAANAECGVGLVLPFGRQLFGPDEGFPPVNRGELQLTVTAAASFGDVGSPELNVQQVEMPGSAFKRFNKMTVRGATPGATGLYDWKLPIGNLLRGALVFVTTGYRNLNVPGDVDAVQLLANNVERLYVGGNAAFEAYWARMKRRGHTSLHEHAHMENSAAMYGQNASTGAIEVATADFMQNYLYQDYDPTDDDACSFSTAGLADLVLRTNIASAEAMRVMSYESVQIAAK